MLKQEELVEALHAALKAANPPCGRLCVAGIEAGDGTVKVWHNGVRPVEGDHQTIVAEAPLKFSKDQLSGRLKVWIEGQHRHEFVNLNAALEIDTSGPVMTGWPWEVTVNPATGDWMATITATFGHPEKAPLDVPISPNVNPTWRWSDGTAP